MRDFRRDFNAMLENVDDLLAEAKVSVGTKLAADEQSTEGALAMFSEAIAETDVMAKNAAAQLQTAINDRIEKRAEKVAIARHLFRTGCRLLSA